MTQNERWLSARQVAREFNLSDVQGLNIAKRPANLRLLMDDLQRVSSVRLPTELAVPTGSPGIRRNHRELLVFRDIHAGVSRNQSLRTTQLKARYELREGIQGTQRIAYSGLWAGV